MPRNLRRILIALSLLFVCACHKQSAQPPPEKPHLLPALTVPDAMMMFYGNFDAGAQSSTAVMPGRNNKNTSSPASYQAIAHAFFHAETGEAGTQKLVVVTYAVPKKGGFGCHACAPTIGMAVFTNDGMKWAIEASNKAVTESGGWGEPPTDIQLVEIGHNHHGVQIKDVGGGQGETTAALQILVPWNGTVNAALKRIVADNDAGMCGPDSLPCYSNERTLAFVSSANSDYYGVELKLTGTDLPDSSGGPITAARAVSGVEILKFENGVYVQVSREGDLTTVDQAVADQEGLK